jgi:hypothetical protein
LDLNRETGLHLGVGDAVLDVSADKNYVGFGLGQALGFGKAKDRGWNLQLGGGNVLDVSLTRVSCVNRPSVLKKHAAEQ